MNRRTFIRLASASAGAIIVSPSLVACGPATSVAVRSGAKTVATWFAKYMVELAAQKTFDTIVDFVQNQSNTEAAKIDAVNRQMANNGFTNNSQRPVYTQRGFYSYEVGHHDSFNGCVAIYDGQKNNLALAEGPTVVGLAKVAEAYRDAGQSASQAADSTFVTGSFQNPSRNAFSVDYNQPYVGYTNFGTVHVDYRTLNSTSGEVNVIVTDRQGYKEFEATYPLQYS